MIRRSYVVGIAVLIVAAGDAGSAAAHDLRGTVRVPPDGLIVEARFSDDTPARGASVSVLNASNEEVAAGRTDEQGVCTLPRLAPGAYTAAIESIGHRDVIRFEVADTSNELSFANPRLSATLGVILGVAGLLAVSLGYRVVRRGRRQ